MLVELYYLGYIVIAGIVGIIIISVMMIPMIIVSIIITINIIIITTIIFIKVTTIAIIIPNQSFRVVSSLLIGSISQNHWQTNLRTYHCVSTYLGFNIGVDGDCSRKCFLLLTLFQRNILYPYQMSRLVNLFLMNGIF